jgi:hypothetical protein
MMRIWRLGRPSTNPLGQRTSRKAGAGKTTMTMIIIIRSGSTKMIANVRPGEGLLSRVKLSIAFRLAIPSP